MSIFFIILMIVLVLWILGMWFGSGEDLSSFDHPVEPGGAEACSGPGGASAEHETAVAGIRAMGSTLKGLSQKQITQFARDFMEDMSLGKSFPCQFIPVDVSGVPAEWVLAPGVDGSRRVLYIHGGAFIAGSPNSHRTITCKFSEVANAAVLAVDYRLMPENPRVAGIEDCRTAYRWILANGPTEQGPPSRLFMGGDSAGGNLSLVMAAWARDQKLRVPDTVVVMSPLTDSRYTGPSIRTNLPTDTMLGPLFGWLVKLPKLILAWIFVVENRFLPRNPGVSPVYGDLSNLPPTLVQVSESEMLLDDARRYVNKARKAGSPVYLQSWSGLLHVWQIFYPDVPEAGQAWERIGEFLARAEQGAV